MKNYLINIIIFSLLFLFALISGKAIGGNLISAFFNNKQVTPFFLTKPAFKYIKVYNRLNNPNELERLTGYYALLDYNIIDLDFLKKRFFLEEHLTIKKTIIWIMGHSNNKKQLLDIFNLIYNKSDKSIKNEIDLILNNK
jgi:hypothetical protein